MKEIYSLSQVDSEHTVKNMAHGQVIPFQAFINVLPQRFFAVICTDWGYETSSRKWNRGRNGLHQLGQPTVPLNNFRADGVQENQVHSITIQSMEVPNLNFQPIPPTSKFYSIAT